MEVNAKLSGNIFDIQGFSVHDGPGARTLIFMKGCSLNCFWCSNPEGISQSNLPLYYESKCILCENCIRSCPHQAIKKADHKLDFDRMICEKCKTPLCVETCYTDALRISGRSITENELFRIIERDRQFWGKSGGVTFSGGEPLLQADFLQHILKRCFHSYIHTAIETCGSVPWTNFEKIIDSLDLIFFDIKHHDPEKHKNGTGAVNDNIIRNIEKLNENYKGELVFRLPLIPGFNSSLEDLKGIASLILKTKWKVLNILPLHHMGKDKYDRLGKIYKAQDYKKPLQKDLIFAKENFTQAGIQCYIGNELPI